MIYGRSESAYLFGRFLRGFFGRFGRRLLRRLLGGLRSLEIYEVRLCSSEANDQRDSEPPTSLVGSAEGSFEGCFVGSAEGSFEGCLVGSAEGSFEGCLVG